MTAVGIEEAVTALALETFDAAVFPFAFLQAFGNRDTTLKKLRTGVSNKSDVGGVLQTRNIHIKAAQPGSVSATLAALPASPATAKAKARFVLATEGTDFEAEHRETGETVACAYADSPTSTAACSRAARMRRASARSRAPTCCTSAASTGPRSTPTSSAR
jgi:hypothetical protein